MIKDIVFDFGGVVTEVAARPAMERFAALGVKNVEHYLNSYRQNGIFYELENGDITAEGFVCGLSALCGRTVSHDDAKHAWLGFIVKTQTEYLEWLQTLRPRFRLSILSNTNPFLQEWARSEAFTPCGKSLDDYFDSLYLSYLMNCSKPDETIYRKMLSSGMMNPEETLFLDDSPKNVEAARRVGINTLLVENGGDWRPMLKELLGI